MAGQTVAGTFTGTSNIGDVCIIPTSTTSMKLTLTGADASNTAKTRKRTTPGGAFVDQVTYNSAQTNTAITVAAGEEWQLVPVAMQAGKELRWKLSCES